MKKNKKSRMSQATAFLLLFGMVSLFSDMTHEGAASIQGVYFSLLGASAGAIGFISGFGELTGYSLRFLFGRLADKTKLYWPMTILGYVLDIAAVPALALVGPHGWIPACCLLVVQRLGKAMKKPAKDTILSFAASQEGAGRFFGIQEFLDQIGTFLGPILLFFILLLQRDKSPFSAYSIAFALLAIPALLTLLMLFFTKRRFPSPENFEADPPKDQPFALKRSFVFYIIGISLFAFGFVDYSLIIYHVSQVYTELAPSLAENTALIQQGSLPLLYAGAMLTDALAALFFGALFDKRGSRALVISTLCSAPFPLLIFLAHSKAALLIGIGLWGIGMGAQESILKAAVARLVPKNSRAAGYDMFEFSFGICWFLGSWIMGMLYEINLPLMALLSFLAQLAAIPFYIRSITPAK